MKKILDVSSPVVGCCADCRFWIEPITEYTVPISRPGDWKMCGRTRHDDGLIFFEAAGYDGDHGEIVTRADFGCVQFAQKLRGE